MALSGDRNWRRGNPNWKKGGPSPTPKGRGKGAFVKANQSTYRVLRNKKRNPVEELILVADSAKYLGGIEGLTLAADIWKMIHTETTAHSAPLERRLKEVNAIVGSNLVDALEGNFEETEDIVSGAESPSNTPSVGAGKSALPAKANPAGNLRLDNEMSGVDIRSKLLAETGEDDDDGDDSLGDSSEDAEQSSTLRSAPTGGLEEVPPSNL